MDTLRVGMVQFRTGPDKRENLLRMEEFVALLGREKVELVVLPEMFQCPYEVGHFPREAEQIPEGETVQYLMRLAQKYRVYLVGGSIPERKGNEFYNTSVILNPEGEILGIHRKIHLFDVDFADLYFQESSILSPGHSLTLCPTPWGTVGVMICYDLRFPELARLYALRGAKLIVVPGAFNPVTGPLHWELLFRARAVDNQVFMIGASPAPHPESSYQAYGHSLVVDPLGRVIRELGEEEAVLINDLDLSDVDRTRQKLPLLSHRRTDLYAVTWRGGGGE